MERWTESLAPSTTNSTSESFHSDNSPASNNISEWDTVSSDTQYISRKRTRTTFINSFYRSSIPVCKLSNDLGLLPDSYDKKSQQEKCGRAFNITPSIVALTRVWKRVRWMNVSIPRYIRLCTGSTPYIEYARRIDGPARQRVYLSPDLRVERVAKNKLILHFDTTQSHKISLDKNVSVNSWVLFFETKEERDQWAKMIQDSIDLLVWIQKYTPVSILFEKEGSTVIQVFSQNDQDHPSRAIKVISTETKNDRLRVRNELRLHLKLTQFTTHPNVLTLYDSLRQPKRAYLVLEHCPGGDLFDFLSNQGAMEENLASILFYYIVQAVAYVHAQGVVHLDLKPENLLFQSISREPKSIKLADFGSARMVDELGSHSLPFVSCSIGYSAPELIKHGMVSYAADVFSLGAVLYTMLCGYAPFHARVEEQVMVKSLHGEFSFEGKEWQNVSTQAKDLIRGMLELKANDRLSLDDVLHHPWLTISTCQLLSNS